MSEFVFKLPDLGEGTVEAEIVEWHVAVGDEVAEGDALVDVMTDKANVEVPAPVAGKVLRTSGEPGDMVAVGAELIAFETSAKQARTAARAAEHMEETPPPAPAEPTAIETQTPAPQVPVADDAERPAEEVDADSATRAATSPAIRKRAKEAGVDLADVAGSGPGGRILREDFDAYVQRRRASAKQEAQRPAPVNEEDVLETKVIGVRRVIAQRMAQSHGEIPHFAYVEEVDVTELEALRGYLNETYEQRLTVLPFIATALLKALGEYPGCNAHYDAQAGMLRQFKAVHLGIATQTDDGLKVPVVKDAGSKDLWQLAEAIRQAAQGARDGTAKLPDLSGSTITLTSLGRLGGIASTPIINYPEVAIVGVNKAVERPVVVDGQIQVRTMMNLSSSFDHRFIDGADAAQLINLVKSKLEHPASLWLPPPRT